ncbi:coiled-coil domain-containing protein 170-like [Malaclemys terrapin pileata]|uniref:coiled-coil domain-containing protein 170-like n=1 Tax=Malaclemys terrapin pileata TaxID=2991368 RepID=UPI0023A7D057|nr:coiled-coil domain-containing protein 170-like [Malaclemys terrapin pileata]
MSDLLEFLNYSNSGALLNANEGKGLREDGQPANGSQSFCQSISEGRDSRDLCVSLGPLLEADASRYQLIRYRKAADIAHCEYAALLVKNSSLQTEIQQLQSQLVTKEASLQEMKSELEIYEENNARQSSKIQTLKAQVKELEEIATSVTSVKSQSGAYIYTLKRKNQELSERVSELEKHLR